MTHVIHKIPPVYNKNSQILILGSFPSVKSREGRFFYHHKQNRFWKVLSTIVNDVLPETIDEKKDFLLKRVSKKTTSEKSGKCKTIILYIKKLVRTLRCLMRTKYEEGRIQNVDDFKEVLNNVLSNR